MVFALAALGNCRNPLLTGASFELWQGQAYVHVRSRNPLLTGASFELSMG
ncbi:hypothetical protein GMMP1_830019 [Candidatus Magnetomoraceae bacterium gMMP-1]